MPKPQCLPDLHHARLVAYHTVHSQSVEVAAMFDAFETMVRGCRVGVMRLAIFLTVALSLGFMNQALHGA